MLKQNHFTLHALAFDRKVHYNTVREWLHRMGINIFYVPGPKGAEQASVKREDGIKFINLHTSGTKPKRPK